ncbi:MAG: mechanosensitive ion channel [Planctomycetaceae bacterium]
MPIQAVRHDTTETHSARLRMLAATVTAVIVLTGVAQTNAQTSDGGRPKSPPSLFQITPLDRTFPNADSPLQIPSSRTSPSFDENAWQPLGGTRPADSTRSRLLPVPTSDSDDLRSAYYERQPQRQSPPVIQAAYGVTIPASQPPAAESIATEPSAVTAESGTEQNPVTAAVPGTGTDAEPVTALLSPEDIQQQRTLIEQTPELSDEVRSQALKLLQRAADSVRLSVESARRTSEWKAERDNAAAMIAEAKALLAQNSSNSDPAIPEGTTLAELEQFRLADEVRAEEARKNLEAWEARAKQRTDRKPQMPTIIEKARQQLADARKSLDAPAPEGEPAVLTQARQTDQMALVQLLQQQLDQYRIEQVRYEALAEWFPLQRDYLSRTRNTLEKRTEFWKSAVAEARRRESERQAQEARETLRNAHPALRDLAERNSELTQQRKALQERLAASTANLTAVNRTLDGLEHDFRNVVEKEARAGLTTGIGLLLRNQRNHLPSTEEYVRILSDTEAEIVRMQLEQMQLEDERDDLTDLDIRTQATLDEIQQSGVAMTDQIQNMVFELLRDRKRYLYDLLTDYGTCLLTLGELDVSSRRLTDRISEYENYIDERVLWIRSASGVDTGTLQRMVSATQVMASPRHWAGAGSQLIRDVQSRTPAYGLALMAGLGLLVFSRRIRILIRSLGRIQHRRTSVGIPSTLLALGLTVVLASWWPAVTWLVGWRMSSEGANDFTRSVADALQATAIVFWSVEVFRQLCRPQGIAETFLDWPVDIIRVLRIGLRRLLMAGLPLVFLVVVAERLDEGKWADSLGRAALVTFCVLLTVLLRGTVRPDGAGLGEILRSNPTGWMSRTKTIWYPVVVSAPIALAALALMGYVYTAQQLMLRLQLTLSLCVILTIAYTMITQWMLEARRRLAMEQARSRRAAAMAAAQQNGETSGNTIPAAEIPRVDLSVVNQQMLHLVQGAACVLFLTFGWMIWSRVLPALQILNRVELWTTAVTIAKSYDLGNGQSEIREVTQLQPIMLGALIVALGILGIAVLASRNLPGLLELSVLQRLPLDHGGRHAVTTLCRYALMLTGIVMACRTVGIGWSSVQWLLAALTVGLGFGLQEIFANFISGLIILFERPIRIGDVVTIDGVSGSVSRIQIRATTITDWDRKEYIVPNKEFVTGRLLNWTLSDKTNRVMINVGVAYGSDTEKALNLMLRVAEEHPLVMDDPAPVTTFEGFGDSCLNMVLRCYLPNLDNRLKVITDLHSAIDREFRKARIEIAFPQRDLHLRTVAPGVAAIPLEAPEEVSSSEEVPDETVRAGSRAA